MYVAFPLLLMHYIYDVCYFYKLCRILHSMHMRFNLIHKINGEKLSTGTIDKSMCVYLKKKKKKPKTNQTTMEHSHSQEEVFPGFQKGKASLC